jgi:hypothetical protein
LGLIYEEMGAWPKAILAFQRSAKLHICLPEPHLHLARALYHQHNGELGPDLLQGLIERLQMVLCLSPENEIHQAIRQRIHDFPGFLASAT